MEQNPPCEYCAAYCCKQTSHSFAVLLEGHEVSRFEHACLNADQEWCLPYINGKCPYLNDDDKCSIYENRPDRCREFSCLSGYKCKGENHSFFLEDHPDVVSLIELHVLNTNTI